MADHNIYIHAVGTGSPTNQNPTVPWSQKEGGGAFNQTQSQSDGMFGGAGTAVKALSKAAGVAQNPDSVVSGAIAGVSKALPWVAAAYAVIKVGVSVADNVTEFSEIESGNYAAGNVWRDVKTMTGLALHPVSSLIQAYKTERQWERQNKRFRAEQELLGGSVINSYTNRGV